MAKAGRGAPKVDAPATPKKGTVRGKKTTATVSAPPVVRNADDLIAKAENLHKLATAIGKKADITGFYQKAAEIIGPEEAAKAFKARGMAVPEIEDAPPTNIPAGAADPVTSADDSLPPPPRQQAAKPRAQSQADRDRDARMARAAELEKRDPDGFGALKKQGWSAEAIGNMNDTDFFETVRKHLGDRTPAPEAAAAPPRQPADTQAETGDGGLSVERMREIQKAGADEQLLTDFGYKDDEIRGMSDEQFAATVSSLRQRRVDRARDSLEAERADRARQASKPRGGNAAQEAAADAIAPPQQPAFMAGVTTQPNVQSAPPRQAPPSIGSVVDVSGVTAQMPGVDVRMPQYPGPAAPGTPRMEMPEGFGSAAFPVNMESVTRASMGAPVDYVGASIPSAMPGAGPGRAAAPQTQNKVRELLAAARKNYVSSGWTGMPGSSLTRAATSPYVVYPATALTGAYFAGGLQGVGKNYIGPAYNAVVTGTTQPQENTASNKRVWKYDSWDKARARLMQPRAAQPTPTPQE